MAVERQALTGNLGAASQIICNYLVVFMCFTVASASVPGEVIDRINRTVF